VRAEVPKEEERQRSFKAKELQGFKSCGASELWSFGVVELWSSLVRERERGEKES
jgi:hypothetical protein